MAGDGNAPWPSWHAAPIEDVLGELRSSLDGLSDEEAAARLALNGPNRIPAPGQVSAWTILSNQLRSVVVALLAAAAFVSLAIGERLDAAAVLVVLVINTALGFTTEWRARRAMDALLRLEASRAFVRRGGQVRLVSAETLVRGDVVQLDAGNRVPADIRIAEASDLTTDEAPLTGESLPAEKNLASLPPPTELADRSNMAYMGTTVVGGRGAGVVVATGAATELGRIDALVGGLREEPTPLEKRLDALGRRLVWLTMAIAAVVAVFGAINGLPLGLVLQTAIALAVAAMPEALPAVATIALAVGVHRMARRRALVRRLPAVEALGSTTVVCTDKTRTLTTGEMTVVLVWTGFQEIRSSIDAGAARWPDAAAQVLRVAGRATPAVISDQAGMPAGLVNPVDVAVTTAANGLTDLRTCGPADMPRPVLGMVPFSSARKMMAIFHAGDSGLTTSVKGALMSVLPLCRAMRDGSGSQFLDDDIRRRIQDAEDAYARTGLRILAVASGSVTAAREDALVGLTFDGLIAIADPVAPGVRETVSRLARAGLRTVMITGDQRGTAEAIGRDVGLFDKPGGSVGGRELAEMTAADVGARLHGVQVFYRVSPEHKLTIVSALQQRGEIVAMLGDGVNDAAALKKADVGVAMGIRGTDVARQAADIVLQDDRFETIAAAVEEGRVIFDNIRKFVFYLFSCNVAEVLILLIASVAGMPLPLQPLQLLWLNIVTDTFPALALAVEPGDATVMRRAPRDPQEAILSPAFIGSILLHAGMITAATLAAFAWAVRWFPEHASTVALMTLAFAQILHLGTARSDRDVLVPARAFRNRFALVAVLMSVALQLATLTGGLSRVLNVTMVPPVAWLAIVAGAAAPAILGQLLKLRRHDTRAFAQTLANG